MVAPPLALADASGRAKWNDDGAGKISPSSDIVGLGARGSSS